VKTSHGLLSMGRVAAGSILVEPREGEPETST